MTEEVDRNRINFKAISEHSRSRKGLGERLEDYIEDYASTHKMPKYNKYYTYKVRQLTKEFWAMIEEENKGSTDKVRLSSNPEDYKKKEV